jgi:hypothetical protein
MNKSLKKKFCLSKKKKSYMVRLLTLCSTSLDSPLARYRLRYPKSELISKTPLMKPKKYILYVKVLFEGS